ncbi:hypothetical protein [Nodosilinea sp. P-1105]|uniref:hypothetical protein n=1 Tax=Nodosilinea sp. P-1105 TaxID=2546229 RepID=UPI00146D044C|nr:hypothetical protein [Nodosilinea sp. P-1105]NMF85087.1 hypothetical protein [Nodosilinea sp. P-1105]
MTLPPFTDDRLYRLLPAIYRIRDGAQGEPLRALLAIAQQEFQALEQDIDQLYDDWFIETCAQWVVPYIGDLLDVGELYADGSGAYGQQERRAYVANTLAYRRRKGTTPILEQLTQDVTGWRSRAVEFSRLVNTSQTLARLRPESTTVNLRANDRLEQIGTPFEQQAAYSVDVRSPQVGGRYNVPNVGLYVWRLQSYPLGRVQGRAIATDQGDTYYNVNPVGLPPMPLFNQPQTKTDIVTLAQEINVPAPLRRPVLADELAQRRQRLNRGEAPLAGGSYFDRDPVFQIFINGQPQPLVPETMLMADLGDIGAKAIPWGEGEPPAYLVAVDPERGHLVFRPGLEPERVEASYFYGFSDDLGGGPYNRIGALPDALDPAQIPLSLWHWSVQRATSADPNPLATAIDAWNRTVTVRYGLRRGTHIPLALVAVPPVQVVQVRESERDRPPEFRPGWVRGLGVSRGLCPNDLTIGPGLAVDREGRPLRLACPWRLDVVARFESVIREQPDQRWVLVLFYQPTPQGNPVELGLWPKTALKGYPPDTVFPLAELTFTDQLQLQGVVSPVKTQPLRPGILQGLDLQTRPGTLETVITPGTAVDTQGNPFMLTAPYPLDLAPYQGSQPWVVMVPSERGGRRVQLLLTFDAEALRATHIPLARLDVPSVTVESIQTEAERVGRDPAISRTDLTVSISGTTLQVSPGALQIPDHDPLTLDQPQFLDLAPFAGRTLLVFLAAQANQGWPLGTGSTARSETNAHGGLIPVDPPQANSADPLRLQGVDTGWIVIRDSATYVGDLTLAVPPSARLKLLAADGVRPHVQGAIAIQGWSQADLAPAEISLNGLLVEGKLQILPGSLGRLTLQHCTLVPQLGGLQVASTANPEGDCDLGDFSLLAFVAYALAMVWQLIAQDLGLKRQGPSLTMTQFLQTSWHQLMAGLAEMFAVAGHDSPHYWGEIRLESVDNDRLEIYLERTICGPITLAATVARLHIAESVVDAGAGSSQGAIAAPGTALAVQASTVLGRTSARELEASDSLFTEKVTVGRHQVGCLRFCYVPVASSTPSRYRCQPDLALAEALDNIPGGIVALGMVPSQGQVLVGTAKDGLFRLGRSPGTEDFSWEEMNGDLPELSLTALTTYPWPDPQAAIPTDQRQTLVGTTTGRVFRVLGDPWTAGPETEPVFDWRPLPLPSLNGAITALYFDPHLGQGQVRFPATGLGAGPDTAIALVGIGTRFSQTLQPGDVITIQDLPWRVESLGRQLPSGTTLTARGRQVTLQSPTALAPLQVGDTLTVERALTTGASRQTIGQTRTIVALNPGDATVTVNAPFGEVMGVDQAQPVVINIDTELVVTAAAAEDNERPDQTDPVEAGDADSEQPPESFTILRLWVTSDGSGLWRGTVDGQQWQPLSMGLTTPRLTAIVRSQRQLWLGTAGGGMFRLGSDNRWQPVNQGMPQKLISALVVTPGGRLLAATPRGIFGLERDRDAWENLSTGLTSLDITVLAARHSQDDDAQDANAAPANGVPPTLLAGSRDGKLFSSQDEGQSWERMGLDFRGTDITALTIDDATGEIWLGTAAGALLRGWVDSEADSPALIWQSIQQGRLDLATKLHILNQLQPSFTSTRYGEPGYMQLRQTCPSVIRTGAEDGAEMGVFNALKQAQREANLLASLDEYLRFGLAAGIFYMT